MPYAKTVTAKISYKNRALLTNHEANLARFWLSSFIFAFFMNRDRVEVHKIAKKNHATQYPFLLIEDLVNQGFIAWPKRKLFLAQSTGFASS